jgi:putative ABC transport system substrate-binding protein
MIVAGGDSSALAAKAATTTIPVVFSTGRDPVEIGLVSTLSRPSGNVTGVSFFSGNDLEPKRLELLRELLPKATTIAYLMDPNSPFGELGLREARKAALSHGLQILVLSVGSERELEAAFASLAQQRAVPLLVGAYSLFNSWRDRIAALAAHQAVPTMHFMREFTATGGLMSYGTSIPDAYRQAGIYAGGILKGANPADLPIILPTKYELVINLTTAKAFGLDVPLSLLVRADELLE